MTTELIRIHDTDIQMIEHEGLRVITLDQMDQVHERPRGTAKRNFNHNKKRMEEGKHFFRCDDSDGVRNSYGLPHGIVLLTERGYLVLVKSFRDDLAWQVQAQLVEGYFRAISKPEIKDPTLKLLVDTIYRLDDVQVQVQQAQEKADLAVRGQTWITIRQYVAVHGLIRQLPPGTHQQQYGKYLVGYCMDKGLPVYKQTSIEGWNENTYPVWAIEETLTDWLRGQTRQLPITKTQNYRREPMKPRTPLSEAAQRSRRPPAPGDLASALQDRIHPVTKPKWQSWPDDCLRCGGGTEILTPSDRKDWWHGGRYVRCVACGYHGVLDMDGEYAEIIWHCDLVFGRKPKCDCAFCTEHQ